VLNESAHAQFSRARWRSGGAGKEVALRLSRILEWAVWFGAYESVTIGAALLLVCCGGPEVKAQRLLNQAQVLERAGKEQEAQQLLDEVVKGYPQTTAATKANELLNQEKALRNLLSSALAANEASALARMRTIGTAQLIHRSTSGKFGSLEVLADSDLLPGMSDGISNGYKFRSAPRSNAEINFTATAEPVQNGKTGRTFYFTKLSLSDAVSRVQPR
jgi:hypothetical protein